jgi:GT2 family glycosyltransferase
VGERVGVVVVNWNETALSLTCLRSVLATAPPGALAVLVDNGSSDDPTLEIRRELPQVVVVRLDANGGYAAGCNAGAEEALALGVDYLFFLNNDATVEEHTVAALLAAARRRPDAIFGPKIVYADDPDRVWSAGGRLHLPSMRNEHVGRDTPSSQHREARRVDWTTGCAIFVSRGTYRRVGPFAEDFFLYLEDVDWCLRARRAGVETWFAPEAIVRHRVSSSTSRLPAPHVLYYGCRNTYRLAFRYAPALSRIPLSLSVGMSLLKVAARNVFSRAHRQDPMYRARSRALFDVVRGRGGPLSETQTWPAEPRKALAR